jgi:serine/threonine protein phosphatase 1
MSLKSWLFGPRGRLPDDQLIYAIGDIHGRDDLLALLHGTIEQDLATNVRGRSATVLYLGDYVDRGPDSKAVLDRLIDHPIEGAECVFLKGNHEDAMLRFLGGAEGGDGWLALGGGATAKSYGISLRGNSGEALPTEVARASLSAAVPHRHMAFLNELRLFHQAGDYLFVHAGIRPGRPLEEQDPHDMLWIRKEFLRSRRRHGSIVVHGHASGSKVVVRRNRICVDTMAYATDRLSCVVLEGTSQRFITAEL